MGSYYWTYFEGIKIAVKFRPNNIITASWNRTPHEKLMAVQLVNKSPDFYGTRTFITVITTVSQWTISGT
jgi:hypothetical protein